MPWPDESSGSSPESLECYQFTISAFIETGQAESLIIESIKAPLQRCYTGRKPVIPSSLFDTPCATLGVQGVLDRLNATLGTSYTLGTPSLSALLEDCIEKRYDFGTACGHLRRVWNTNDHSNIRDVLHRLEEEDQEMRRKAVVGNKIVKPNLLPQRAWDLYSNRMVPWGTDLEGPK
ncbi:uncharacterized protein ARMOST_13760 [Armillaria ostoyae]|uniref:Uncharacterized protein n=1 Tax=Armillaria ostoyae TaxID=47428 RepID=A0A284RNR8_ARMOS|nr:uncharacterized protein ARMOST_13760 [Armillaria ostoyae]